MVIRGYPAAMSESGRTFSRRALFTVAAAAVGVTALGAAANSAGAAPTGEGVTTMKDGRVRVDVSKVGGLQWVGGAVPIGRVGGVPAGIIRTKASKFHALDLRCTHGNSLVTWKDNVWVCQEHGCTYSPSGKVRRGPATKRLRKIKSKEQGSALIVGAKPAAIA